MTDRDPQHTANPLPWEAPAAGQRPWSNDRFAYVLDRTSLKRLLVVAVGALQEPCCDDPACTGWLAACEGWHSAFNDLTPEDQVQVDSLIQTSRWHYPPDPGEVG